MSDDLRIYNRHSGQGAGFRKQGSGLERFKKGRTVGDMVRGVFLELEATAPGTAWVNLEGERLLAQLPDDLAALARRIFAGQGVGALPTGVTEADFPLRQGDVCFFVLEGLDPEPVLRMLSLSVGESGVQSPKELPQQLARQLAREQAQAVWRSVAGLPPAQLAARYVSQRNAMDSLLRRELWNRASAGEASHLQRYLDFLQSNEPALEAYSSLNLYRAGLILALKPYGLRGLCYLPWLNPEASCIELAVLHQPEIYIFQARLPGGGRFEARGRSGGSSGDGHSGLRAVSVGIRSALIPPSAVGNKPDLLTEIMGLYPETTRSSFSLRT